MTNPTNPDTPIPSELVDRLRGLLAKATKGPWHISAFEQLSCGDSRVVMAADGYGVAWLMGRSSQEHEDDATLIVETVNALPDLLSLILSQEEIIKELVEGVNGEIMAERRRQVEVEGWTPEHDDTHGRGDLADAAACYAHGELINDAADGALWPWDEAWWKPKDRRYDLIRAAALIVAEIERRDRARSVLSRNGGGE